MSLPAPAASDRPVRSIPLSLYTAMTLQYAVGGAFLPFVSLHFRDQGLDYTSLGWIYLGSSAVAATVPFFWGFLADRWLPADRLYGGLHLGGAAILVLLARQESFAGILVSFLSFCVLYFPTSAILSALAYHNLANPDVQFGRLRLWGSVGWMIPSLPIFLWLSRGGGGLRFVIDLAAAIEVVLAGLAAFLPHTPPGSPSPNSSPSPNIEEGRLALAYGPALRDLLGRGGFRALLAVAFLMQASFTILFYYSPLFLEDAGIERGWIGLIQCLGVVVEVPLFFVLPIALRRMGYRRTIGLGCAALVARHALYAFTAEPWILVSSYVFAGMCVVFYLTGASLAINSMADRSVRASAQTLLTLVGPGLGQMFGHRVVGWIAEGGHGLTAVFLFAGACAAAALLILASLPDRMSFARLEGAGES